MLFVVAALLLPLGGATVSSCLLLLPLFLILLVLPLFSVVSVVATVLVPVGGATVSCLLLLLAVVKPCVNKFN